MTTRAGRRTGGSGARRVRVRVRDDRDEGRVAGLAQIGTSPLGIPCERVCACLLACGCVKNGIWVCGD